MKYRRERPYKRTLPSGKVVWVARYTGPDGKRRYAKPAWNGHKATFARRADAQRAIDEAYELPVNRDTVGGYAESWTRRRPRSEQTNETNERRLAAALDVTLDGRPLREWPFAELRRRQVNDLVDCLLREGRAVSGVRGILSTLSAMCEDAIDDEIAPANPFRGIRLRANDPRAQKPAREIRVWTWEQMREFARGGRPEVRAATPKPQRERRPRRLGQPGPKPAEVLYYSPQDYEAMILALGLCGLRLGELFALRRSDYTGDTLTVSLADTDTKRHRRVVPVPPSLAAAIDRLPPRIDTDLLFPTPAGRQWTRRNFYRDVWEAAKRATGMDPRPHEFRHSWISQLRAAGVDDADLAQVAGHTLGTMLTTYTHPLGRSHERIRGVIG